MSKHVFELIKSAGRMKRGSLSGGRVRLNIRLRRDKNPSILPTTSYHLATYPGPPAPSDHMLIAKCHKSSQLIMESNVFFHSFFTITPKCD